MIDPSLLQSQIALAGVPRTMPNRFSNLDQSISSFGDMLGQRYQAGQQLQLQQAQQLAQWKLFADLQGGNPNIDNALLQNPYGRMLYPNLKASQPTQGQSNFSMGMSMSPLTGMPMFIPSFGSNQGTNTQVANSQPGTTTPNGANFNPLNPVSGSPVVTSASQSMKTPFGETSTQVQNPSGEAAVAGAKAAAEAGVSLPTGYAKDILSKQANQAAATSTLDNITLNLASDLKSHFLESGGGGPLRGNITKATTMFGQSPATFGLQNTVRDSAIAYARDLAGGQQGVQRLFQAIGETIPQAGTTQDQAGTALLQMHLTATQLQAGMQKLGLTPEQMSGLTDQQVQQVLAQGAIGFDRNAEIQRFGTLLQGVKPTPVMNMEGKTTTPTLNPVVNQLFFGNKGTNQNNTTTNNTNSNETNSAITNFIQMAKSNGYSDEQIQQYLASKQ